jgi:hypothetical protein
MMTTRLMVLATACEMGCSDSSAKNATSLYLMTCGGPPHTDSRQVSPPSHRFRQTPVMSTAESARDVRLQGSVV